jgi:F-box protein 11
MSDEKSRAIIVAPSSELTVASRLAERTLAARAARAATVEGGTAPTGLASTRGRTLVVGSTEAGAYATIGAAVDAAQDGDRVLVRPGTYRESVAVSRSIEIVGDGETDEVIVEFDDSPCFVLKETTARIGRLTVRCGGQAFDRTKAAILIVGGSPVLEALAVTGSYGIVVEAGASPTISTSLVHGGASAGIWVRGGASGTIEANEISGNASSGVVVEGEGTAPVIRANTIHDGKGAGIWVHGGASGTIEANEIFGNAYSGIEVKGEGTAPLIRANTLHDGRMWGIFVRSGASGTIEANEIFGNAYSGIAVEGEGTAPVIRANTIRDGEQTGIWVRGGASGTIEANEIFGNAVAGIEVLGEIVVEGEGTAPVIRANTLHDGRMWGIFVSGGAIGTIEANEIFGNAAAGIGVEGEGTAPVIRANTIHDGEGAGIIVFEGAGGTIVDNMITGNRLEPFRADEGTSPHVAGNTIG